MGRHMPTRGKVAPWPTASLAVWCHRAPNPEKTMPSAACPGTFDTARVNHAKLRLTDTSDTALPGRRRRIFAAFRHITRRHLVTTTANGHCDCGVVCAVRDFQSMCHAVAASAAAAAAVGDRLRTQWERTHG